MSARTFRNSPQTKPFVIRLNDTERADLERRTDEMALGIYAHVVWSRIDANGMTAINLPHFKND